MNIGNKIKALRLKSSTTQEALAERLGVSSQSISKWENNVCAPDISLLPAISEFFGVTIDELFDLSVDQKLHRIENMLDYEKELSAEQFRSTEKFLLDNLIADHRTKEASKYLSAYAQLTDHNAVLVPVYEAYIAFAEYRADDGWKAVDKLEQEYPEDCDAIFEVAGIYANNARYEEALDRYKKLQKIYKADHKEHICIDHLHAQAQIYEILGEYEDAVDYVNQEIQFLRDEWNITEGAAVDELEGEKRRLIDKMIEKL